MLLDRWVRIFGLDPLCGGNDQRNFLPGRLLWLYSMWYGSSAWFSSRLQWIGRISLLFGGIRVEDWSGFYGSIRYGHLIAAHHLVCCLLNHHLVSCTRQSNILASDEAMHRIFLGDYPPVSLRVRARTEFQQICGTP